MTFHKPQQFGRVHGDYWNSGFATFMDAVATLADAPSADHPMFYDLALSGARACRSYEEFSRTERSTFTAGFQHIASPEQDEVSGIAAELSSWANAASSNQALLCPAEMIRLARRALRVHEIIWAGRLAELAPDELATHNAATIRQQFARVEQVLS